MRTTTKEINQAINTALATKHPTKHFQPFAKMYLMIANKEKLNIKSVKTIREIYNQLFMGIFKSDIFPKTLFRNNPIYIKQGDRIIYQPLDKEVEIIKNLKDWISFINNDKYTPLIKAFIAHFFFESIHPFNDGNGRTGRFILCTYLANKIDRYTAISFSQEINRNTNTYYKAFATLNNPVNYGEITFFIINMFKIVLRLQSHILKTVNLKLHNYNMMRIYIQKHYNNFEYEIILILVIVQYFNQKQMKLNIRKLKKLLHNKYSAYKLRKVVKILENKGTIKIYKEKPLLFNIKQKALFSWCQY